MINFAMGFHQIIWTWYTGMSDRGWFLVHGGVAVATFAMVRLYIEIIIANWTLKLNRIPTTFTETE